MPAYAFWVWVRDLDNGDAEIKRMTNDGGVEARIVVPVQERMEVARALMRPASARQADVCRAGGDPDAVDPSLLVRRG